MHRRDVVKLAAALLGSAVSASCTRVVLSGVQAGRSPSRPLLDGADLETVARIAELIIPRTDTPGAIEAGVPEFIHQVVAEWYVPAERDIFLAGLRELDRRASARTGLPFVRAPEADQIALLATLEAELPEVTGETRPGAPGDAPFFAKIKELTVLGYYTSEVGSRQELLYRPVPGTYSGDALFADFGRQFSL
jgi:gluconate 2-dehydrogenase gamma chain